MEKKQEIVLKLIKQEQENNGMVNKYVIARKASLLNIDIEEFEKTFNRLIWSDYIRVFGRVVEITDKGMNYLRTI